MGRVSALFFLLCLWARTTVFFINGQGKVRFFDYTGGSTVTLTEGDDPVIPTRFGVDLRGCATRVQVRGGANAAPYYATLTGETLEAAWTETQQDDWTWSDFANPTDAFDVGAVSGITSGGTIITVDPDDAARTWGVNFWPHREGWIIVEKSVGTGLTFTEARPVIACDACSAGGTATVTLGYALDNAASGSYDRYRLIGTAGSLVGDDPSRNDVWRLFNVVTPGGMVEGALLPRFGHDVPFAGYHGDSVTNTKHPAALLVGNGVIIPATFKILPQTGQIRFDQPVVKHFNTQAVLDAGGTAVKPPDDVYVMLAYSRGALTATYPPDSGGPVFAGDALDAFGYERTHMVDLENWLYQGDSPRLEDYAEMIHAAMSVPKWSGRVVVLEAVSSVFEPPARLSLDAATCGDAYDTGHESLAAPIRGFRMVYHRDGARGVIHSCELSVDSQRDPITGDEMYLHTTQLDQLGFKFPGGTLDMTGAMPDLSAGALVRSGMNFLNQTMAGNMGQLQQPMNDLGRVASDQANAPGALSTTATGAINDIVAKISQFIEESKRA